MRNPTIDEIAEAMVGAQQERDAFLEDARFLADIGKVLPAFRTVRLRGATYYEVTRSGYSYDDERKSVVVRRDGTPGVIVSRNGIVWLPVVLLSVVALFLIIGGLAAGPSWIATATTCVMPLALLAWDVFVHRVWYPHDRDETDATIIRDIRGRAEEIRARYAKRAPR